MIKRYERRLLYLINNLLKWMFKKGESVLKEKEFQGLRFQNAYPVDAALAVLGLSLPYSLTLLNLI